MKQTTLTLKSEKPLELIDITERIQEFCAHQKTQDGLLVVSCLHTTGAVCINEKCQELEKDFQTFLQKMAPAGKNYHHDHSAVDGRPNAHSHLLKYFMNSSETLVVSGGKLQLGTWQSIFFIELDGPRPKREVQLTFLGH